MNPLLELPPLPFGLRPFGLLLTFSVIVSHLVFVRRARSPATPLGTPGEVEALAIGMGLLSMLGAWSAGGLVATGGTLSSAGGFVGALIALVVITRALRLDLLRAADAAAYAFPFGWFFARAGCAIAHDHLGKPSTSFLAVSFPTGPRLDLGLLEWLATPFLITLVVFVSRRARRDGLVAATLAVAYGLVRFVLDFFRVDDGSRMADPRWFGLSAAQWVCLLVLLPAGMLAFRAPRSPSSSTPSRPA